MSTTKSSSTELPTARQAKKPRGGWKTRLPFYYGWLIVAGGFFSLGITYTVWYSFTVFYVALLQEFGWSRAASAGVFSLFVIVVGVAGTGAGALVDRFGPKRIVAGGTALLTIGLLACSQIQDLLQFYLMFGIVSAIGLSATGWVPVVTMINRWFSARLGAALGTASAGIGVGITIMVPVSQMLITQFGWRTAYIILAGVVFFGVMPITLLVMETRPEDLGLHRDGRAPTPESETARLAAAAARKPREVNLKWTTTAWTLGSAVHTYRYWVLAFMMMLANIGTQMIMVHQVAFLVDGGLDKLLAASIAGMVGMFSIGTKAGWGWMSDRLGREVTWTIGLSSTLLAITLLISTRLAPSPLVLYLYPLVFAFGYGATAPLTPAVVSDLFAGRNFGVIYGSLVIANGIGSAIGAWFAGLIFDLTGSYFIAFGLGGVCSLISIACMWVVAPRLIRRVPGRC
ncbi:MAG TPA: MFS transporter [Chloroflexota bacterium]|nr:MFS transporter [Chloroflexota bacterium]